MAKIGRLRTNEFRVDNVDYIKAKNQRFPIELNTYDTFYISRGYNIVCPCRVLSEHKDWKGRPMAWVLILDSKDGRKVNIYSDELGRNPEEAIINQCLCCG